MYCEVCGFKFKEDDTECIVCMTKKPDSAESEDMIYCPKCGKRTNGKKAYCRDCGKKLFSIDDGRTIQERKRAEKTKEVKRQIGLLIEVIIMMAIGFGIAGGIDAAITTRRMEKEGKLIGVGRAARTVGKVAIIVNSVQLAGIAIAVILSFFVV